MKPARCEVGARFQGGVITSDGGGLLLREVEMKTRIIGRFARCFTGSRDATLIKHWVEELCGQRIYALARGYKDLNDHDDPGRDPLLARHDTAPFPTTTPRLEPPAAPRVAATERCAQPERLPEHDRVGGAWVALSQAPHFTPDSAACYSFPSSAHP